MDARNRALGTLPHLERVSCDGARATMLARPWLIHGDNTRAPLGYLVRRLMPRESWRNHLETRCPAKRKAHAFVFGSTMRCKQRARELLRARHDRYNAV